MPTEDSASSRPTNISTARTRVADGLAQRQFVAGGRAQQARLDGRRDPQRDQQHHAGRHRAFEHGAHRQVAVAYLPLDVVELVQHHGQQAADPQHHGDPGQPGDGALQRPHQRRILEGHLQHLDAQAYHGQRHQHGNRHLEDRHRKHALPARPAPHRPGTAAAGETARRRSRAGRTGWRCRRPPCARGPPRAPPARPAARSASSAASSVRELGWASAANQPSRVSIRAGGRVGQRRRRHWGFLFSMKACTPSCATACAMLQAMDWPASW